MEGKTTRSLKECLASMMTNELKCGIPVKNIVVTYKEIVRKIIFLGLINL
jgi:hypothetical protein